MARLPRLDLPNMPQHIIPRGNNKEPCFFEEQDYKVYLSKLNEFAKLNQVSVHAFVLMTNHVHLLVTASHEGGVSKLMQMLGSYYVRYINKKYERTGTLWEGRYKSTLVDSEQYLLTVSRYIELNPVRADMVEQPAEYPWSSFRKNALGVPIELITPHITYKRLGKTDKLRQKYYLALFETELTDTTLESIRSSVNKSWVLGSKKFCRKIEKVTGRAVKPKERGGDRKSKAYAEFYSKAHRFLTSRITSAGVR